MSAPHRAGRHFLQIPGPTNVPDRILRAIAQPTIDHRGPAFAELTRALLPAVSRIFRTAGPVIIYPSSGTGAWEAALVNVLAPGDRVLATGVTSDVAEVRAAIDAADHPALLLVDTISSLASIDYRHDQWGVDVTVGGSQKGLMLPPGLGFNAVSAKALEVARQGGSPRSYFDWDPILAANRDGFYPYTPATNLLYGLGEAIAMLEEQTLDAVFARHQRHGQATRAAVRAWGLEVLCQDERRHSGVLTAVVMPDGHDADALRERILERFDMSLGAGLGRLKGRVFRIGHLGDFNDLMLAGTLCGVEMGLALSGVPIARDGVAAALACLETAAASGVSPAAVDA